MITKMSKYSFLILDKDRETFLSKLQEYGVVDIKRSEKSLDEKSMKDVREAEILRARILDISRGTDAHLASLLSRIEEIRKEISQLELWGEYDIEKLSSFGISYYRTTARKYDPSWEQQYAIQKVSEDNGTVLFVIVGSSEEFPLKPLPAPSRTVTSAKKELESVEKELESYRSELADQKSVLPQLQEKLKEVEARLDLHIADKSGESAADNSLVIYEGFAPSETDESLKESLDKESIYYICSPASAEDMPPVKLKNNRFTKQFEVLTSMYGMPVYDEFDPTVFLSIFFLLFFAMCMGDAGYGLLLICIGFALKGKDSGLARLWSLIVTLGIGTTVVGLVMGGFFGLDLSAQSWVPDWMKNIMITGDITIGGSTYAKQMVLSLLIGILHICLAMIMKAIYAVRNKGFKNSLSTLGWTLLIVGGVAGLAVGLLGVISEAAMKWILIVIAGLSALGIYLFNKWGRNPLLNIGSGLWDTYSMASGLMGDVLSYIRLYALGLSGGMLGSTFNQIAEMVKGSNPTWHWIPFILIILIGHALNLAMSCLGAFVHPLRLNFVEFFKNSDYQGRGKTYRPLKK